MSTDYSIFSLLSLVESIDKATTSAAACRVGRCEVTACNRGIMIHIEKLLKHAQSEFAKLMNDCRPINCIPPEILTQIFYFAGRGASVIKASYVCKWWRQVALASPILWSLYDPSQKSTRLDLVLGRSKDALLDIRAPSHDWIIEDLSPFRHQIGRLHTLDIMFNSSLDWSVKASSLAELFPSAAVRLTRLSLGICFRGFHESDEARANSSCLIPLFGNNMPSLKVLRLDGICIWPQCSGPSLQCLILRRSVIPFLSLVSLLHATPNLEVLVLETLAFPDFPHGPQRIIMMEHLRVLRIGAKGTYRCAYLLYLLSSFSVQEGIVVSIDIYDNKYNTWSALEMSSPKEYVIDGIRALYFGEGITALDDKTCFRYTPDLWERINNARITADGIRLFGFLHCRLDLVTHFEWAPDPSTTLVNPDISMVLRSMPSLESLMAVENEADWGRPQADVTSLLEALLETEPITHIPRYALRLEKISIKFRRYSKSFGSFAKLLSIRSSRGYPIKQVEIVKEEAERVQQMREYVQDMSLVPNVTPSCHQERISKQLLNLERPECLDSEHFSY